MEGDDVGEKYPGSRDFDSLKRFVEDLLEVKCDIKKKDGCTDKETTYLEKFESKSSEERQKQITRLEGMAGDAMKAELKLWLRQRLNILHQLEMM